MHQNTGLLVLTPNQQYLHQNTGYTCAHTQPTILAPEYWIYLCSHPTNSTCTRILDILVLTPNQQSKCFIIIILYVISMVGRMELQAKTPTIWRQQSPWYISYSIKDLPLWHARMALDLTCGQVRGNYWSYQDSVS